MRGNNLSGFNFGFGFIFISTILFATECTMHINKFQNNDTNFSLVLTHDKNCKVIMDEYTNKIVLVSKSIEENITTKSILKKENTSLNKLITLAKSKIGNSYMYGKTGPEHFDCSGFVYYVFKENGISIPRTSLLQSQSGKKLSRKELKKGDILSFDTQGRKHVNHSGIYLGNGKFIHASSGKVFAVTISELDQGFYVDKFRWGIRKLP
jgi:cell wall-associated NlpC family hydrolase